MSRRKAIPLFGPFIAFLFKLTGCGGGGGGGGTNSFTLGISGVTQTILLTDPNPTALEITRAGAAVGTDERWLAQYGQFVKTIRGQTFEATDSGQHWIIYRNGQWQPQSADQLRCSGGDTIEWRLES